MTPTTPASVKSCLETIEAALSRLKFTPGHHAGLYEPIVYSLEGGGKRLRPVLLLMVYDLLRTEGDCWDEALPAALALEVFHNFTLLHDDLMDDAPMRRGKPTVYRKWGPNTAILSGDAMLIQAYSLLEGLTPRHIPRVLPVFNHMALRVCEGQQDDMDFIEREEVSPGEYLRMIHGKTSALIAGAMQIGAILADAGTEQQQHVYQSGMELGVAFQLVDDYLDVYGKETFGKRRGGDIAERKKTWLAVHAAKQAAEQGLRDEWHRAWQEPDDAKRIAAVSEIYDRLRLSDQLLREADRHTHAALENLRPLGEKSSTLRRFVSELLERQT